MLHAAFDGTDAGMHTYYRFQHKSGLIRNQSMIKGNHFFVPHNYNKSKRTNVSCFSFLRTVSSFRPSAILRFVKLKKKGSSMRKSVSQVKSFLFEIFTSGDTCMFLPIFW